jgi:hypothetical protein
VAFDHHSPSRSLTSPPRVDVREEMSPALIRSPLRCKVLAVRFSKFSNWRCVRVGCILPALKKRRADEQRQRQRQRREGRQVSEAAPCCVSPWSSSPPVC